MTGLSPPWLLLGENKKHSASMGEKKEDSARMCIVLSRKSLPPKQKRLQAIRCSILCRDLT